MDKNKAMEMELIEEYETEVFKSLKTLRRKFKDDTVKDKIALLNKWLSITVADTSGHRAIGWEISDDAVCEKTNGQSSFDPNFSKEHEYVLPNGETENLWVRVSPCVKKLFECFLTDDYLGYGNILHYNDILRKYIHMCVDIDIEAMRVKGIERECECGCHDKSPIFPIDVIKEGIPLSQAFLGEESRIVLINWFKSKDEYLRWNNSIEENPRITNINFIFSQVGDSPKSYKAGLDEFIERNSDRNIDTIVYGLSKNSIGAIKEKRIKENRREYTEDRIPFALAYTFSMFILAANNYCAKIPLKESPLSLGRVSVAFVPVRGHTQKAYQTALLVTIKTPETLNKYNDVINNLIELSRIIARPLQILESDLVGRYKEIQKLRSAHTKTAVGSIMSRNGSHNIGSHVLAALSHNVGSMPDDRMLYQYIQQRMDYIATVTTDFPNWSVATHFVGDVMRTFFSQHHLLEHISESEGLHAYHFQGDSLDVNNDRGAIQIKIYGYRGGNPHLPFPKMVANRNAYEVTEFIKYDKESVDSISLEKDVSVAIPGGVVGQHAFYTIFENFIRNAAKHSWSCTNDKNKNLIINIAFHDDSDKDVIPFLIWDELSNAHEVDSTEESEHNTEGKTLVSHLESCFNQSFVEDGRARQENWGLAEMKISAGYLQKCSIKEIGGIADEKNPLKSSIITPVAVESHLGYLFNVPRPKDILIVTDEDKLLEGKSSFVAGGIWFASSSNVNKEIENAYIGKGSKLLDFSFIVYLPGDRANIDSYKIGSATPYRFLVDRMVWINDKRLAKIEGATLRKLLEQRDIIKIRNLVYSAWIEYLKDRYPWDGNSVKPKTIDVLLKANGELGAEKGLVTDEDVFATMFSECYHSVILDVILSDRESLRGKRLGAITVEERFALFVLAQIGVDKEIFWGREDSNNPPSIGVMKSSLRKILRDHFCKTIGGLCEENVLLSIANVCLLIKSRKYADALVSVKKHEICLALVQRMIALQFNGRSDERRLFDNFLDFITKNSGQQKLRHGLLKLKDTADAEVLGVTPKTDMEKNLSRIITLRIKRIDVICDELLDVFESMFVASDIYLRKYEERIVSLPVGYRVHSCEATETHEKDVYIGGGNGNPPVARLVRNGGHILYRRHDSSNVPGAIYSEALSGSQSYLNSLAHIGREGNGDDLKQLLQMTESGLLRMLVIDERADRFIKCHPEMNAIYAKMGIGIVDVEKSEEGSVYKNGVNRGDSRVIVVGGRNAKTSCWLGIERGDFDILVIHQGIIDKWWPGLKHNAERVGEIIKGLMEIVPYTVVTTGRGRPDNIPKWAKVIPFSSVETFLFRRYPEKMLLVNTVMSVLPFSEDAETPEDGEE